MGSLLRDFLFLSCLLGVSVTQNEEHFIQIKLDAILEAQHTISRILEEQEKKIDSKMESLEEKIESIEEKIESVEEKIEAKIEDLRVEYQQCAQRDQLDIFQRIFTTDECEESHNCSEMAICEDAIIGYACTCLPGYYGDGFQCQDIDECKEDNTRCGVNDVCSNNLGSYSCICPQGYKKEGSTCQDVCKSPSLYIEDIGCITLITSKGIFKVEDGRGSLFSWNEAKRKCKFDVSGGKLLENIAVDHLQLLSNHFSLLTSDYPPWIGVHDSKWLSSGTTVEYNLWRHGQPDGGNQKCVYLNLRRGSIGLVDVTCPGLLSFALCQVIFE